MECTDFLPVRPHSFISPFPFHHIHAYSFLVGSCALLRSFLIRNTTGRSHTSSPFAHHARLSRQIFLPPFTKQSVPLFPSPSKQSSFIHSKHFRRVPSS